MRIRMHFTLENEKMPIDYRRSIISFIKLSLSTYNEESYKKYYNGRDNIIKPYAFSVFFRQPKINNQEIVLADKSFEINLTVSTYDAAIELYNSFNNQKYKKFSIKQNSWTLQNITLIPEKEITQNKIIVKFQSPLCVRKRKNNKDCYYSYEAKEFEETLVMNIKEQLKGVGKETSIAETFKITPINAKKVIIKFYEKKIECSTGIFELNGDKELLEYLYKSGMGSKHSSGFRNVSS